MKNKNRLRTYILILLVIMLPFSFKLYSPILMSWGIRNGVITASTLVFAVWFILSLFLGRSVSCGYTCPYGALQELLGLHLLKKKPQSEKADKVRYFVFVFFLIMVSYALLKVGGLQGVDLFASNGKFQLIILVTIFVIGISLISVLFGSRAFCRYLCPQGVFLTIGTKLGKKIKIRSLYLKSDQYACTDCKLCDKFCPMGLNVSCMVTDNHMDNSNCILCGECIKKCPKEAINYSFNTKDKIDR